jgi:hypothetical protein
MTEPRIITIPCHRCGRKTTMRYDGLPFRHRKGGGEWCGGYEETEHIRFDRGEITELGGTWVILLIGKEFLLMQPFQVEWNGRWEMSAVFGSGGDTWHGNEYHAYRTLEDSLQALNNLLGRVVAELTIHSEGEIRLASMHWQDAHTKEVTVP